MKNGRTNDVATGVGQEDTNCNDLSMCISLIDSDSDAEDDNVTAPQVRNTNSVDSET